MAHRPRINAQLALVDASACTGRNPDLPHHPADAHRPLSRAFNPAASSASRSVRHHVQLVLDRVDIQLEPIRHAKLLVDRREVIAERVLGNEQP